MVSVRNTLIEIGWPQPKLPTQIDNYTAVGFTNNTIINKAMKSLDMKLWWLQDRQSQEQFRYYWAPRPQNEGVYITKHHPQIHH